MDDIELHVFGPGYGEGLLLHLGHGDWIVVDSCVDTAGQPSALKWLRHIGVDPATAVKLVVATHWHDDHVRGLAEVFRACASAQFVCSGAMLSEELLTLAYDAEKASMKNSSGVDELRKITDELVRRQQATGARSLGSGHVFASSNCRLFQRQGSIPCEIWSLSPSSAELQATMSLFAEEFSRQGAEWHARRRIIARTPNTTSVVLWISVGQRRILLGADLEVGSVKGGTAMVDAGWSAIVSSSARPQERSSAFKIPHHGSPSAHHDGVWDRMLGTCQRV
ncbi:MAG: MBL fold metallo-hydrolase [Polyangiaceae bacterium]|nr:MBL fold metallo-hydrolase [Polyangiaceae bacterium]